MAKVDTRSPLGLIVCLIILRFDLSKFQVSATTAEEALALNKQTSSDEGIYLPSVPVSLEGAADGDFNEMDVGHMPTDGGVAPPLSPRHFCLSCLGPSFQVTDISARPHSPLIIEDPVLHDEDFDDNLHDRDNMGGHIVTGLHKRSTRSVRQHHGRTRQDIAYPDFEGEIDTQYNPRPRRPSDDDRPSPNPGWWRFPSKRQHVPDGDIEEELAKRRPPPKDSRQISKFPDFERKPTKPYNIFRWPGSKKGQWRLPDRRQHVPDADIEVELAKRRPPPKKESRQWGGWPGFERRPTMPFSGLDFPDADIEVELAKRRPPPSREPKQWGGWPGFERRPTMPFSGLDFPDADIEVELAKRRPPPTDHPRQIAKFPDFEKKPTMPYSGLDIPDADIEGELAKRRPPPTREPTMPYNDKVNEKSSKRSRRSLQYYLPRETTPELTKLITENKHKPVAFLDRNIVRPSVREITKDKGDNDTTLATYDIIVPIFIPAVRRKTTTRPAKSLRFVTENKVEMVPVTRMVPHIKEVIEAERVPQTVITDFVKRTPASKNGRADSEKIIATTVNEYV